MDTAGVARSPCTHIGHGVRVALDWDYHRLARRADRTIGELTASYHRTANRLHAANIVPDVVSSDAGTPEDAFDTETAVAERQIEPANKPVYSGPRHSALWFVTQAGYTIDVGVSDE